MEVLKSFICISTGEFFGVWVPVDSEEGNDCIPVSEIFTRASDRTTSRRR